jgi:hypothetical protein
MNVDRAMTSEELHVYRRIISEQITLQELQQREAASNDPLGVTRRIKHQRRLLSQLWSVAHDLGKLTPLV